MRNEHDDPRLYGNGWSAGESQSQADFRSWPVTSANCPGRKSRTAPATFANTVSFMSRDRAGGSSIKPETPWGMANTNEETNCSGKPSVYGTFAMYSLMGTRFINANEIATPRSASTPTGLEEFCAKLALPASMFHHESRKSCRVAKGTES